MLPPAQPAYILRGHASQIHATAFIRSNSRLVTGDADGWLVVWSLATKRPATVWRAHEGSILGARGWGDGMLITHGKDNKLIVWKLSDEDEVSMSITLPVETPSEPRKQPWLLHVLHVNTMNFCSFAQCDPLPATADNKASEELLIAVPNTMSSESVDIFHLPSSKRIHTVPGPGIFKGGMVMAVHLLHHNSCLTVITGYESGHALVSQLSTLSTWQTIYFSQAHTQPILSLDVLPSKDHFLTSSADANLAKHPIPIIGKNQVFPADKAENVPVKTIKTKHAGQQSLKIRNDGKIFATAGWDSKVRVYTARGMKEMAVLKWHNEGCYAVSFALVENGEKLEEGKELVKQDNAMTTKEGRIWKAKNSHWLAAGSKDGKISLWDIY